MTHRQFLGWLKYNDMEFETPTRTDFYLMQIAQRVQQVLSTKPNDITIQHQKLKFVGAKSNRSRTSNMTPEQAAAMAKAKWFSGFGGTANIRGVRPQDS